MKPMINIRFLALIAALSVGWFSAASAQNNVPVAIGGEADYDACGGSGVVSGLKKSGDGFLAVRSGPGSGYQMVDKIYQGQAVYFCDQRGDWVGIVYSLDNRVDCGTGSPVARRQPYSGPCRSGWAFGKYLKFIAG